MGYRYLFIYHFLLNFLCAPWGQKLCLSSLHFSRIKPSIKVCWMNDLLRVTQLIRGWAGTRTKPSVPPNPISLLSYQDTFWKKVGSGPIEKLIKHLAGLWTMLRGFLFNFPFPSFLILVGILGRYSELSQGHIYILAPEIAEFITSSEEEVSPDGFEAPSPALLPGVNKHFEVIWGWLGENVKGFDPCFLKYWRVFCSCWSWTTRLEISWAKVCFSPHLVTQVDCGGPILATHKQDAGTWLWWNEGGHGEERGTQACTAAESGRNFLAPEESPE